MKSICIMNFYFLMRDRNIDSSDFKQKDMKMLCIYSFSHVPMHRFHAQVALPWVQIAVVYCHWLQRQMFGSVAMEPSTAQCCTSKAMFCRTKWIIPELCRKVLGERYQQLAFHVIVCRILSVLCVSLRLHT